VRTKELPYLDVLSESVNNPLRLFLGWFALVADKLPPLSLALAYWMVGAFFMATKRYAEYRFTPVAGGFFAYYLKLGLQDNSPVQNPKTLHTEKGLLFYMMLCVMLFVLLMFTRMPVLYEWFNIEPSLIEPLWTLGPYLDR
jgi:hypothetical protein